MNTSLPPPMPKPIETGVIHQRRYIGSVYTAEQMRDYAQQAVEAEREACAEIAEVKRNFYEVNGFPREFTAARALAEKIRARSTP